jgi:hypothetical protein
LLHRTGSDDSHFIHSALRVQQRARRLIVAHHTRTPPLASANQFAALNIEDNFGSEGGVELPVNDKRVQYEHAHKEQGSLEERTSADDDLVISL